MLCHVMLTSYGREIVRPKRALSVCRTSMNRPCCVLGCKASEWRNVKPVKLSHALPIAPIGLSESALFRLGQAPQTRGVHTTTIQCLCSGQAWKPKRFACSGSSCRLPSFSKHTQVYGWLPTSASDRRTSVPGSEPVVLKYEVLKYGSMNL